MNFGMRSGSARSALLQIRVLASNWNTEPSSRTVVSWPAAKRLAATRTMSMTSGVEPSGKVAWGHAGEDVVAGLAPTVLDVRRELS